MKRIVIETDDQTKEKLKALAFKENKTMKTLIAEAIKLLLRKLR